MSALFLYVGITIAGYWAGKYLRRRAAVRLFVLQTAVVGVLVFLMGCRIGANEQIIASLGTIGLQALLYTLIIMLAAVAAFWATRRLLGFDRYGNRTAGLAEAVVAEERAAKSDSAEKRGGINHMTLLIIGLVALGLLAGYFVVPPAVIGKTGPVLTVCLCLLLLIIGIDLGQEGTIVQNFRRAGWRVLAFPLASVLSMVAGAVIAAFVLRISVRDSLCIGAGFGWYTLAPAMLSSYSAEVSALSFLHNVMREMFGVVFIPLVADKIGYLESYAVPGSPSMDVCLPIVEQSTNSTVAVYAFINGAVLSATVPVLVSLFMQL